MKSLNLRFSYFAYLPILIVLGCSQNYNSDENYSEIAPQPIEVEEMSERYGIPEASFKIYDGIIQKNQFLADILLWAMRILLFVSFISKLGIESSSFVAVLGAMGLAIGLALQGSLSNFAGGVLIILFKPFKIGDFIEAQGVSGEVKEIEILYTKLRSSNNQAIFVPNGVLSNGTITNYSMEDIRRGDLKISVSYDTNLKEAKDIIFGILNNNPQVLQTPAPAVTVTEMNDSAIVLAVRPWAERQYFWTMMSDTLQDCKTEFDKQGIEMQPYIKEHSKKTIMND